MRGYRGRRPLRAPDKEDHRAEGTDRGMCNVTPAVAIRTWQVTARPTTRALQPSVKCFARLAVSTRGTMSIADALQVRHGRMCFEHDAI